MTKDQTPKPAQTDQSKSDLIESIYRIALEPQTYDRFMGHWESYILDQTAKLTTLQADNTTEGGDLHDTEIANHFTIATKLLEQAGRLDTAEKQDYHASNTPKLMFNKDGLVVWYNSAARRAFDIEKATRLSDLALTPQHRKDVHALFSGQATSRTVLVRIMPKGAKKPIPMAFQISDQSTSEHSFLASEVRQSWPKNADALLSDGFGLSGSEIAICTLLVEGQSLTDIAQTRSSAVATVRTQIKKILHKTGCSGQVELMGLLHSTMRLAEADAVDRAPTARLPDCVMNIHLPTRIMPVETFGDPDGTPVIFFHGMLDGNSMTEKLRQLLHDHRFHLISPMRPGFGPAAFDETGPIETATLRFAQDIEVMINALGVKRPILLGHMAGSLYAYATAARLGARVRGIASVAGGVPLVSTSQFASMSARQRIVALTARYTPRVLPFLIRAGISQLDNRRERQFMQSLYDNSPYDLRTIADLELRDIIFAGYQFTIAQGHRAFEIDSYHVVRDWSDVIKQCEQPIELLHGEHDPVVSIASVRDFHAQHSNQTNLTALSNTGQLVLYEQPEQLIAALERLRG